MQVAVTQSTIGWEAAATAARAAVEHAQNLNAYVNVAAFFRIPGAPLHSVHRHWAG